MKKILLSSLFLFSTLSYAEPVFKWTTPEGKVVYSSKPPAPNSKPALLPPIVKADVKLTDKALENCDSHGGIDCEKGADADGSVICTDGYTSAFARFKLYCLKAKLTIDHIDNVEENALTDEGLLKIQVRNTARGQAKKVNVTFLSNKREKLVAEGPETIDGLSSGIFEYKFKNIGKLAPSEIKALTPPKERVNVKWED